jgi:peptide/nickel transport system permease protein
MASGAGGNGDDGGATILVPPGGEEPGHPAPVPTVRGAEGGAGRIRGGQWLAFVLPGLPQALAGRWVPGGSALLVWVSMLGLLAWRLDRVLASWAGPWDHRLALLAVVVAMGTSWGWSVRDALRRDSPEPGWWSLAGRRFQKNRVAVAGVLSIGVIYLIAFLTPFLAPFDPPLQGDLLQDRLASPSAQHLLGTDHYARDVLSRLLYGARISLAIGFVAVSISITIGTLLGAISGYVGGAVDSLIMRFVDMVISFPRIVLLIAIIALFEPSIFLIVAVLGLTQWPQVARIVRGEVLSLREREFILAGRALGFSRPRIIARHVVPNILAPVIVAATLGIGDTIVLEAGLSFLGLGVQPPTPSWGIMVAEGRGNLAGAWWLSTFPGLAIVFTVLAFNLAGDGLRDALDPRLNR